MLYNDKQLLGQSLAKKRCLVENLFWLSRQSRRQFPMKASACEKKI